MIYLILLGYFLNIYGIISMYCDGWIVTKKDYLAALIPFTLLFVLLVAVLSITYTRTLEGNWRDELTRKIQGWFR